MASNDQWPPVAATGRNSGKNRSSSINIKKPTKEHQQQVLNGLTEMFQSTLESEVILSVAHSCDWELQACIDALIAISSTVESENKILQDKESFVLVNSSDSNKPREIFADTEIKPDFVRMNKDELQLQQEELKKFEKLKKKSTRNRMGSFRGNISKLNSASIDEKKPESEESVSFDSIWDLPASQSMNRDDNYSNDKSDVNNQYLLQSMPQPPNPWTSDFSKVAWAHQSSKTLHPDTPIEEMKDPQIPTRSNQPNKTRNESEFCGLKVQYRTAGMESSSDDDDADVVIEEELNCTIPTSLPVNVSQLLSSSIQSPPRVAHTQKTTTVTTASPPRTPKRSVHQLTLGRIRESMKNGEKIMIIMRGLPGSGKSYLARSLVTSITDDDPSAYIFSSDDFFVALGRGVYKYDVGKLDDAHSNNQKRVFDALKKGKTPVIVDNTNLQAWEMRPYAAMAVKRGYIVEILESDAPWTQNINELARKNSHGIAKDKIRRMSAKYEHGITGSWLLEHYSLKYEAGQEPKEPKDLLSAEKIDKTPVVSPVVDNSPIPEEPIKEADKAPSNPELSSRSGSAFVDYQREFKSPDNMKNEEKPQESPKKLVSTISPAEKYLLQALGAIGSERKGSLAPEIVSPTSDKEDVSPDSNEQIPSQIWDPSLLNNNDPSGNRNEKSPMSAAEIQRQDEEFGKEVRREDECSTESSEEVEDVMRNAMADFLDGIAQRFTESGENTDVISVVQQRQSTVVITEVFEELKKEAANDADENIRISSSDGILSKELDEKIEKTDLIEDNINLKTDIKEEKEEKKEEVVEDEQVENISVEDKDLSFVDAENLLDIETAEESKEPIEPIPSKSTLGTILKIIKTSILGNSFDEESSEVKTSEIEQGKELKELSEPVVDAKPEEISDESATLEPMAADNVNVIENPIAEIRAAINSTDSGIISGILENEKIEESEFHSLENESGEAEKNSFMSVLESSGSFCEKQPENSESLPIESKPKSPQITEESKKFEILDNINRITWRESPFPVDDLALPKVNLVDENFGKNVPKSDAGTNTTYYDFNVLYVGGESDPTYRVLQSFNRQINEGLTHQKSERPPLKLMLDKSSMTGDVFTREGNTELEDEEEKKNRIPELMELFPHIPRDYLIEIFEKVKEDFDWAVELLLEVNPDDVLMKVSEGKIEEEEFDLEDEKDDVFTASQVPASGPLDPAPTLSLVAPEYLEEDEEDENDEEEEEEEEAAKNVNEIKLLKEIKTDISDDTCSTSTASASRTESTEDEKSTENDELLEINLGFDFIKALEQQFSYPDFHIPDGFVPIVQIRKSIAEELHACWIESMYQQLNARHEQLDQMIAKDAEFARSLERQLELEEARECDTSEPNLNQIMDMELALAKYRNELKSMIARETPDDLAARLSRQMLHESLPDIDPDAFNEILKAHNGNFKEAFEVIEINTGKSIVPCDTLKKQKILMEKVKEEDGNLKEKQPIIVVRGEAKDEKASYKAAVANARDSREEAHRQFSLKVQNYNKAAEAYRKGYPEVAAYYSQMARLHSKKIDAAHAAAASAFVEAQSWDDEETLDLHNLFVSEALVALDEFLDYHLNKLMRSNKRASSVYIITGRGARSNNRTSKIKPAVSQRLNSKNIKFSEANAGCLKVTLYRKNGTTD